MKTGAYQGHNYHPTYRADIDGLRAVAILAVVLFHAFPEVVRGGFIGVDVFFVISGFLISSIIFRSLQKDDFSFAEFYAHRIKRIFPALIVVLSAVFAAGWFLLLPDEFKQLGKHMAAGAGFIQNFALLGEAGYFDAASETKPLMHLWSLAIEEQFYLIFPLLIWGLWRLRMNVFIGVAILALLSFGANIIASKHDAVRAFFAPETRFWELLAGAMLAWLHMYRQERRSMLPGRLPFWRSWQPERRQAAVNTLLSVLGLILIVVSALAIRQGKHFPGWRALLPVAGAFLLILAGPAAWANRWLLASKPMVLIGLISYPLYLWHWPLLSFAHVIAGDAPSLGLRVSLVVASVVLAWFTYRLVERPLRFAGGTWVKTASLATVISGLGCIGFLAYVQDGFDGRVKDFAELSKIWQAAGEWQYPGNLTRQEFHGIDYLYQKSGRAKTTLFAGDSNIQQYYPRLDELIQQRPGDTNSIIFKARGGCFPVPNLEHDDNTRYCTRLMSDAFELASNMPEIDTVVIGAQWNAYLAGGFGLVDEVRYGNDAYKKSLNELGAYIRSLAQIGKSVYVVLNIPIGQQLDPKYVVQRNLASFPDVFQIRNEAIDRSAFDGEFGQIQADLARVAADAGATVIRPIDFLCQEKCDVLDASGEPIYKDHVHLRPTFVRQRATFMDATVGAPLTDAVN